jgi:Secretion system C-terminal sorting domain/PKD domain
MDDTLSYINVLDSPKAIISVPDIACEGRGTVTANLSKRSDLPITYKIEIIEKQDTIDLYKPLNTYKKTYYGVLPSSINFNDFYFKGGKTYFVLLTLINECGSYTNYDSVKIPLSAKIILERPTVYAQPLAGATSVKLHGYTSSIDSFKWNPTTWLDSANSLTPISTPLDSITYVLTTYKDNCMATDTAYIKYNKYANAGHNDTLCIDSIYKDVLIGYPYDLTLFLGILYYYNNQQFMDYYNANNNNNTANYFRYFTHFMHTSVFQNSFINCGSNMYQIFTNVVNKKVFFNQNWYKGYYNHFIQFDNASLPILTVFNDEVNANSELKNHLDSLTDWGQIGPCMVDMFANYNNFVLNEHDRISARWTKIENADTTLLNNWDELFIAVDAPTQSSKYLLNVITPEKAEIDEITILVDTTLKPLFATALQFDSTVFFMNYTEPISNATTYEWNFGDGSAISNELNPIHTFPAFDSNYVVCLTASNKCNSWQYCDTVWVDSLHLGGAFKTANKPAFFETNISTQLNERLALNNKLEARSKELVALQNYPNPFNQSTIIDYQIWQSFNQAELRITNILGQVLFSQNLQKPIDKVEIDGSNLANGLYYYSIVVDNSVKLTKSMSVIH